jgi:hypothetical protein
MSYAPRAAGRQLSAGGAYSFCNAEPTFLFFRNLARHFPFRSVPLLPFSLGLRGRQRAVAWRLDYYNIYFIFINILKI